MIITVSHSLRIPYAIAAKPYRISDFKELRRWLRCFTKKSFCCKATTGVKRNLFLNNTLWRSNHGKSNAVATKPSLFVYRFVKSCGMCNRITSQDGQRGGVGGRCAVDLWISDCTARTSCCEIGIDLQAYKASLQVEKGILSTFPYVGSIGFQRLKHRIHRLMLFQVWFHGNHIWIISCGKENSLTAMNSRISEIKLMNATVDTIIYGKKTVNSYQRIAIKTNRRKR